MNSKRLNAWQKKVDQYHKEGNHDFCPLAWECKPIKPVVGMGGTHQVGSDSYPYTIIEVSASGKTIKAQRDITHRTDSNGWSEFQTYEFERNPEGEIATFTLRNNGNYHQKGQKGHYHAFYPGHRRSYWDPSF